MTGSEREEIVTLAYWDERFRFAVEKRTEDDLRGRFRWTDDEKAQLLARLEAEDEEGKQPWYLDENGYRLADEKLFEMSPWSIIDEETRKKAVQRFMDCDTGEASFRFTPWFRFGDE